MENWELAEIERGVKAYLCGKDNRIIHLTTLHDLNGEVTGGFWAQEDGQPVVRWNAHELEIPFLAAAPPVRRPIEHLRRATAMSAEPATVGEHVAQLTAVLEKTLPSLHNEDVVVDVQQSDGHVMLVLLLPESFCNTLLPRK